MMLFVFGTALKNGVVGLGRMPCMKSFELGKEMGEKRKVEENFSSFAVDE